MKYVTPSVEHTAFNCPHCGALAVQTWYSAHAEALGGGKTPTNWTKKEAEEMDLSNIDRDKREEFREFFIRLSEGEPFIHGERTYVDRYLANIWFSHCFNCRSIALWLYDKLLYPSTGEAPQANIDMPPDIRRDYEEASRILNLSPRGAAALARLAIQKLCIELGQPGKNINSDIAALVKAGLDARVQQALDAVRVIGNNAVHPGKIDIRDDQATAESLLKLLNLVVERTISEPKHVAEVYASLPKSALDAIEARDRKPPSED